MNYKQSPEILNRIQSSQSILISCHLSPDPDSISSALALAEVVAKMGKEFLIVCESSIPLQNGFILGSDLIKTVNYLQLEFNKFDLFIVPDSSGPEMLSRNFKFENIGVARIGIDHHATNKGWCEINVIDEKSSSTAEILFGLFNDWGVKIDLKLATYLLTGILSDTGSFKFSNTSAKTLNVASALLEMGVNREVLIQEMFMNKDFHYFKYLSEVYLRMELDEQTGIVWSAVPFEVYDKYAQADLLGISDSFAASVKGSRLGIYMSEKQKGLLYVSFRSKDDSIDVSQLAQILGGAGHKKAAGASIENMPFQEAVSKVLTTTREFLSKS